MLLLVLSQFGVAVLSLITELLLNANQLVILSHTVGTREGSSLDLTAFGGDGDVSDGGVLRLT